MTNIIDGKLVAESIFKSINEERIQLEKNGLPKPGLAVVLVGEDSASKVYVSRKQKACEQCGFYSKLIHLEANATQTKLLQVISDLNHDSKIHGILVQSPLPSHMDGDVVFQSISVFKDADGFHPENVGLLLQGNPRFVPCTPAGIIELFQFYEIKTQGKHVVIIGRSNIVGKPLSALLIQKGEYADATVTILHSKSKNITAFCQQADILVAAIGNPLFVKESWVKPGAVVIDVGINRVEDSNSKSGYKLVGDVDYDSISHKTSWITPVPGGVGPMTIAMLLRNTLNSVKISKSVSK